MHDDGPAGLNGWRWDLFGVLEQYGVTVVWTIAASFESGQFRRDPHRTRGLIAPAVANAKSLTLVQSVVGNH
jgi:hypothetical protein